MTPPATAPDPPAPAARLPDSAGSTHATTPAGGRDSLRPAGSANPDARPAADLTVRYFAGARAAAGGLSSEPANATTLHELTQLLIDRHGERLELVLKAASFLVDGLTCHDPRAALPAGATVDVLPPFAGG
jgi:sulfur-carrier protein